MNIIPAQVLESDSFVIDMSEVPKGLMPGDSFELDGESFRIISLGLVDAWICTPDVFADIQMAELAAVKLH